MAKLALTTSPKFRRLAAKLRLESRAHVVGHLEELWNSCHGRKSPVIGDLDDIEGAADWPSTRPRHQFAQALIELGFVDEIVPGRVYAVHDYYDHAPRYIKAHFSKLAGQDPTVGPENYFLGLDAFRRLFEDHEATVAGEVLDDGTIVRLEADLDPADEVVEEDPDTPPEPSTEEDTEAKGRESGLKSGFDATNRGEKSSYCSEIGSLSSQATSKSTTPPPSSPPPLSRSGFSAAAEVDPDDVRRVAAGVVRLLAHDEGLAHRLELRALSARTGPEWTALRTEVEAAVRSEADASGVIRLEVAS